jgi:DNA-binding XRE family transcriptional regulator
MNFVKPHELELTSGALYGLLGDMGKKAPDTRQIEAIAERLQASQDALGLKAAEICRLTGIKPNTYSQWLNAKGRPRLDEAMLLCDHLGYTLDWIYFGDPKGLPYSLASNLGLPAVPPPRPVERKRA